MGTETEGFPFLSLAAAEEVHASVHAPQQDDARAKKGSLLLIPGTNDGPDDKSNPMHTKIRHQTKTAESPRA